MTDPTPHPDQPDNAPVDVPGGAATIVRYDLLTWANMVDLYRAYPGYEGPVSRLKEAGL